MKNNIGIWRRIKFELENYKLKIVYSILAVCTVLWTIIDIITSFLHVDILNKYYFIVFVIIGLVVGVFKELPKMESKLKIHNTNVTIKFGDIFKQPGCKIITVNNYFDSEVNGDIVCEDSIHGQFINTILGGHREIFDRAIEENLKEVYCEQVEEKVAGKKLKYELGTTTYLEYGGDRYLLTALGDTNPSTLKAKIDIGTLFNSLNKMWEATDIYCNGKAVSVALIGCGRGNINIKPQNVLELLLISIECSSMANKIANDVQIILSEKKFEEINLNAIDKEWK